MLRMSSGVGIGVGRPYTTVMIVPTGIGASIGGFAGDALPAAKLLSAASDMLITHPNVMNGAMMYWPQDNIMYIEGHSLNLFARGRVHIQPVTKSSQRIGVIFDKGMEDTLRVRHLQVINAARATLGIDVQDVVVTSVPWEIRTQLSVESGASWGTVEATKALGDAAKFLLEEKGCTAIALVGRFPEDAEMDAQFVNHTSTGTLPFPSLPSPLVPMLVCGCAASIIRYLSYIYCLFRPLVDDGGYSYF